MLIKSAPPAPRMLSTAVVTSGHCAVSGENRTPMGGAERSAPTGLTPKNQPTDPHPDHEVNLGDALIADVYNALRNSSLFESTLLVVTYDEHGGFAEHRSPPNPVPNPDGIIGGQGGPNEFNFTRAGVRVPTIIASPWVPKGRVVSDPPEAPAKYFEHSSMFATLKRLAGIPYELTNRTAVAAPFDFILDELDAPRADCPLTLPVNEEALSPERLARISDDLLLRRPNDLQRNFFNVLEGLLVANPAGRLGADAFATQMQMGAEVRRLVESWIPRRQK